MLELWDLMELRKIDVAFVKMERTVQTSTQYCLREVEISNKMLLPEGSELFTVGKLPAKRRGMR